LLSVIKFSLQKGIQPEALAAVLHSSDWLAYTTTEEKVYYVNARTQGKFWSSKVVDSVNLVVNNYAFTYWLFLD